MKRWMVTGLLMIGLTACDWEAEPVMGEVTRKQGRPNTGCDWGKPVMVEYTYYSSRPKYHGWVSGFMCMTVSESDSLEPGSKIEVK